MVFNATFNNISVISWWFVLLVGEPPPPSILVFYLFQTSFKISSCSCDKVCQWLATGWMFSPVSFINKTDCHYNCHWNIFESGNNKAAMDNWRKFLVTAAILNEGRACGTQFWKGPTPFKYVLIWFSKTYGWTDDKWWLKLTWSLASWAKKDFWIIYDYMALSVSWPTGRMKSIGAWALNSYRWRIIQFKSFARWSFKKIFTLINSNVKTHFIHGDVHLGFLIISYMVMAILDSWYLHTWWWPSWIPDI